MFALNKGGGSRWEGGWSEDVRSSWWQGKVGKKIPARVNKCDVVGVLKRIMYHVHVFPPPRVIHTMRCDRFTPYGQGKINTRISKRVHHLDPPPSSPWPCMLVGTRPVSECIWHLTRLTRLTRLTLPTYLALPTCRVESRLSKRQGNRPPPLSLLDSHMTEGRVKVDIIAYPCLRNILGTSHLTCFILSHSFSWESNERISYLPKLQALPWCSHFLQTLSNPISRGISVVSLVSHALRIQQRHRPIT